MAAVTIAERGAAYLQEIPLKRVDRPAGGRDGLSVSVPQPMRRTSTGKPPRSMETSRMREVEGGVASECPSSRASRVSSFSLSNGACGECEVAQLPSMPRAPTSCPAATVGG